MALLGRAESAHWFVFPTTPALKRLPQGMLPRASSRGLKLARGMKPYLLRLGAARLEVMKELITIIPLSPLACRDAGENGAGSSHLEGMESHLNSRHKKSSTERNAGGEPRTGWT